MSLMQLSNELLLMIAEERCILCALARTNMRLYHFCNGILYDYNARFGKSSALLWAALTGNLATAKLSLLNGGNVNTQNVRKKTPLALAVMKHDFRMMELLLKHGADPRVTDNGGRAPLHWPVSSYGDQLQDLKDEGAHVRFLNYLDVVNWLSSETAERIVKQLLDHGACPNQGDGSTRDGHGWTPLRLAVDIKNRDILKLPRATKISFIMDFRPIPLLSAIPTYELQRIGRLLEDNMDRGFEKVAMLLEEHSSRHPLTNWTRIRPCRSCATRVFKAHRSSTKS